MAIVLELPAGRVHLLDFPLKALYCLLTVIDLLVVLVQMIFLLDFFLIF
jgi:hypothetical protein